MINKITIELPLAQSHNVNNNLKHMLFIAALLSIILGVIFDIFFLKIIGGISVTLLQVFELLLPEYIIKGNIIFWEDGLEIIEIGSKDLLKIPKNKISNIIISGYKKIRFGAKFVYNDGGGNMINSDMGNYIFILNNRYEMDKLKSFLKKNYSEVKLS